MSIKCEVCNKGMPEGISLFRVNEKGVKGIWRCREHLTSEQADKYHSDPDVNDLVNIIDPPKP